MAYMNRIYTPPTNIKSYRYTFQHSPRKVSGKSYSPTLNRTLTFAL